MFYGVVIGIQQQQQNMSSTRTLTERQIISKFLEMFIVPNFYTPEQLDIQDWSEDKINMFKEYMTDRICWDDAVRQLIDGFISDFEKNN
jgi:hypothetical protein